MIQDYPDQAKISICQQDDYFDLCTAPLLLKSEILKAFQLTVVTETLWNNDPNGQKLTRLCGVAFRSQTELKEYEKLMERRNRKDDPFSPSFVRSFFTFTLLYALIIFVSSLWFFFQPWNSAPRPEYTENFANVYFAFTFFFAVVLYFFAISFFFWMWRKDSRPGKSR